MHTEVETARSPMKNFFRTQRTPSKARRARAFADKLGRKRETATAPDSQFCFYDMYQCKSINPQRVEPKRTVRGRLLDAQQPESMPLEESMDKHRLSEEAVSQGESPTSKTGPHDHSLYEQVEPTQLPTKQERVAKYTVLSGPGNPAAEMRESGTRIADSPVKSETQVNSTTHFF